MSSFKHGTGFRVGTAAAYRNRVSNVLTPGSAALAGWTYGQDITNTMRAEAMLREPVAHRVVFHVAHDVFDNWFNLKPTDSKISAEGFDQGLQKVLSDLKAKTELTKMSVFERGFGWAILAKSYIDSATSPAEPLLNPTDILEVKAYSPMQVTDWSEDTKRALPDGSINRNYGKPLTYKIAQRGTVSPLEIHYSRCILFATRFVGTETYDWQGSSALDPAWDAMINMRRISWGVSTAAYRLGAPFIDVTLTDAEDAEINAFIASGAFDNLMGQKFFAHNEKRQLQLISAEGKIVDPIRYTLPELERVSIATKIPLAVLRGAQAGALTGSEVNLKEYFLLISNLQNSYEDGVRDLINSIVTVKKDAAMKGDFKFAWLNPVTLTETEKADLELKKAQVIQIKKDFFIRNEIRKMFDPTAKDLTDEQGGNDIVGSSNFTAAAQTNPSFTVKTNNDGTLTVIENARHAPASKKR